MESIRSKHKMRDSDPDKISQVWKEWILEAITNIRRQKQRPSIQRICHAIGRHHKFHEDIVTEKLEEAVKSGAVIKVYNKGMHSYKAPLAKRSIKVDNSSNLCKIVSRAVHDLGELQGSSVESIEKYVKKFNDIFLAPGTNYKLVIKIAIKKAIIAGYLIKKGKLYKKGKSLTPPRKSAIRKKINNDNLSPEKGIKDDLICSECSGNAKKNQNSVPEPLSACENCGMAIHTTCANIAGKCKSQVLLYMLTVKGTKWYCQKCKTCDGCEENNKLTTASSSSSDKGPCLLGCCSCEKNYHLTCANPVPDKKPKCPWRCNYCLEHHEKVVKQSFKRKSVSTDRIKITTIPKPGKRKRASRIETDTKVTRRRMIPTTISSSANNPTKRTNIENQISSIKKEIEEANESIMIAEDNFPNNLQRKKKIADPETVDTTLVVSKQEIVNVDYTTLPSETAPIMTSMYDLQNPDDSFSGFSQYIASELKLLNNSCGFDVFFVNKIKKNIQSVISDAWDSLENKVNLPIVITKVRSMADSQNY